MCLQQVPLLPTHHRAPRPPQLEAAFVLRRLTAAARFCLSDPTQYANVYLFSYAAELIAAAINAEVCFFFPFCFPLSYLAIRVLYSKLPRIAASDG